MIRCRTGSVGETLMLPVRLPPCEQVRTRGADAAPQPAAMLGGSPGASGINHEADNSKDVRLQKFNLQRRHYYETSN